ncbi:hypothetical protein GEU84_001015 [Fertoebacter nigrum]|uniref:Uncharacterized protein n=1 Tax=Fertoeibacter niger TaxID=2656921 RepID=A0A8X8KPG7_9RHOB|nr:hypothetical protein [Fertoeibacter niger]NUB42952.1 hypothetical protein [Fertoeibacter niger]
MPISEDDLALLSMSDDEIAIKNSNFSFDFDEMHKRMFSGDRSYQLIQAHLYCEHIVLQMVREALPFPEEISVDRMGFAQRFQLVMALGLIDKKLAAPIKMINKLRNKVAHDLTFSVSEADAKSLFDCTPSDLIEAVLDMPSRCGNAASFEDLLFVVVVKFDIVRQQHVVQRVLGRKSQIHLRDALNKAYPLIKNA